MKAVTYLRVSTDEQRDRNTIQSQRHALREFAEREGIELAGEYADEGVSGTVPFGERPGGSKLLQDTDDFDTVLVYAQDRVGRDVVVSASFFKLMENRGVRVRSVSEDLDNPLLRDILSAVNAQERRDIIRRTIAGIRSKVAEGKWHGPVPFGYDMDDDGRLHPNADAPLVRKIFELAADGSSCPKISEHLAALEHDRTASGVLCVLKNPAYRGEGELEIKGETFTVPTPAIVDAPLWNRAQETIEANARGGSQSRTRDYTLRGKLVCTECGAIYTGQSWLKPSGKRYAYYAVRGGKRVSKEIKDCPHRNVPAEKIEARVWGQVEEWLEDVAPIVAEIRAWAGDVDGRAALQEEISEYRTKLRAKDAEKDRIITAFRKGLIEEAELEGQLTGLRAERDALASYVEDLEARIMSEAEAADKAHRVAETLEYWRGKGKAEILDALVERIDIRTTLEPPKGRGKHPHKRQDFEVLWRFAPVDAAQSGRTSRRLRTSCWY